MKAPSKNKHHRDAKLLVLDLQVAVENTNLPSKIQFTDWINAVVGQEKPSELTIRLVDEEEMTELNSTYRHKAAVTNVLSFPFESDIAMDVPLLGDIIICAPVVEREAHEQGKPLEAHWAHLVIHGTLHLLGYDHQSDEQAHVMESREIQILRQFGYANPYEVKINS